jgi:hypothetical protein
VALALPAFLVAGCDDGIPTRAPGNESPVPSRIVVSVTPFASVEEARGAESNIDWWCDERSAAAVTTACAATEIRDHLVMAGFAPTIPSASRPGQGSQSTRAPRSVFFQARFAAKSLAK